MSGLVELAVGPLAGPECRRTLSRRWIRITQVLASLPSLLVLLGVVWFWWFAHTVDRTFQPGATLRVGLMTVEGFLLVIALVLSPATIAGTLAGEKARGILPLLLASNVSSREIATGRLAGRLASVGLFLLASLPAICLLAAYAALTPIVLSLLALLPCAVAFGVGGLALFASAVSRRARDALFAVYLTELLLFLCPAVGFRLLPPAFWDAVGSINPFFGLRVLIEYGDSSRAVNSCLIWGGLGLVGLAAASWQLRRVYLRQVDGRRPQAARRRPDHAEVGDDPMLWKEVRFEHVERFSRFVWWGGTLILAAFLAATFALVGLLIWGRWVEPDSVWRDWAFAQLQSWTGVTALPLSWVIQWTIALRAAVAIASEREHGTWDSLMLSSLEGREIIRAKIWGNIRALRGFIAAAAILWTTAFISGAMDPPDYWTRLSNTIVFSVFITAVGVTISLSCATATKAMTVTIGIWLAAAGLFASLAAVIVLAITLVIVIGWFWWISLTQGIVLGGTLATGPPFPMSFETGWTLTRLLLYAATTALTVIYCGRRFDRLAGRVPGSRTASLTTAP